MVKLAGIFTSFNPITALLVGDFMLDRYTKGRIQKISPEAPVPILSIEEKKSLPGGAGNVALNLVSLGAKVIAIGRTGEDLGGEELLFSLQKEGVDTTGIFIQREYKTPVKNRLIAASQQILRVDDEKIDYLLQDFEDEVIEKIRTLVREIQIVVISDYGKGFLTDRLTRNIIDLAGKYKLPVVVDPKGPNFSKYKNATVIKPNLLEAYVAAKLPHEEPLEKVAHILLRESQADMLLITRSAAGISLFQKDGRRKDFPVQSREVKDVTGAGDTVLATIGVAIANRLDIDHAIDLANVAAGVVIQQLGCARITLSELACRLLQLDSESKIFNEDHLYALKELLKGKQFSIVSLNSSRGMTTSIFRIICRFSSRKLIIYVKDNNPDMEFVSLLSCLKEVDFIILQSRGLKNLCETIHPSEVFDMQGDRLVKLDGAKALQILELECIEGKI